MRLLKKLFGRGQSDQITERVIHVNHRQANQPSGFLHNGISTAKYNAVTLIPKFLIEQFSLYANLFFLFTALIQQIPDISPTNPYSTAIPLFVMVMISFIKSVAEDLRRHQSDAQVNNRDIKILMNGVFVDKKWTDVHVGDIVRVEDDDPFPSDLILLSSSEPDAICYIETSNLDGETNLKIKQGRAETAHLVTPEQVQALHGVVHSELPNSSLYTYDGTLKVDRDTLPAKEKSVSDSRGTAQPTRSTLSRQDPPRKTAVAAVPNVLEIPIDPNQVLLRGAVLKNTRWVYALVIFTGHDTKLMRNASATPIKMTNVDRMTNIQILFLFCILLAMSLASSVGTWIRDATFGAELWYLRLQLDSLPVQFLRNILTFLILYNNLIPISLMVSREFVKYIQAGFVNNDLDMYYEPSNTPANFRTSSLVEELGQIEYVFSDKTGTLTRNIMEFRQCCIAGRCYSDTIENANPNHGDSSDVAPGLTASGHLEVRLFNQLTHDIQNHAESRVRNLLHEFMMLLAVCHTVIPERDDEDPDNLRYQAASPDEGALVEGAARLGYKFHTRRPQSVTVSVEGVDHEVEILAVCEFNSTRKRMSAVVRHQDGRIVLYTKGADTVILERLSQESGVSALSEITQVALGEYASEGLRTLVLAYRDIPEEEYAQWSKIHDAAQTTLNDRSGELDKAAELIEKDLTILGATAIEDKLQEGVPETIHTLAQAGIKIWVLTGDRQETAINIGYSCKLLTESMSLIICNEKSPEDTKAFLERKLHQMRSQRLADVVPRVQNRSSIEKHPQTPEDANFPDASMAFVIDGGSLNYALQPGIDKAFLEVASKCKAVICCRVSPLQKALVVKLVKREKKAILLAIGDGANDVSMIQAAHVGVGISGQEGMQAARSADIAISQFRFLRKLLLVHGAWSYNRLSKLILYSFYKNITLYMTQFWFALFNGFSGQTIYESWVNSSYNVLFAVAPPMVMGIFEQYVCARMLDRYPQLYAMGREHVFFNVKSFWSWTLNSLFHSLVIFFSLTMIWGDEIGFSDGRTLGLWSVGMTMFTSVLGVVTVKAALSTDWWVVYAYLAIFGSMIAWMVLFPIYSIVAPKANGLSSELIGTAENLYASPKFWLTIIVVICVSVLRDYGIKYYRRLFRPRTYHIVQEIQKFNIQDYRPRMERFQKAIHKVRAMQKLRRTQGFAFSQAESGQADLIRIYDTTRRKPKG